LNINLRSETFLRRKIKYVMVVHMPVTTIKELKEKSIEELQNEKINIIGRIIRLKEKTVEVNGKETRLYDMLISDGTDVVRFSWWRPRFELEEGDIIKIISPIPKEYKGRIELTNSFNTRVIYDPIADDRYETIPELDELKKFLKSSINYIHIDLSDIHSYDGKYVEVYGTILKVYKIIPKEKDGNKYVVLILGIDDETGYAKVVASSRTFSSIIDIPYDEVKKVYDESTEDGKVNSDNESMKKLLQDVTAKIIAKEVKIKGRVKIIPDDEVIGKMIREVIYANYIGELEEDIWDIMKEEVI